jgi:hypothetical protein
MLACKRLYLYIAGAKRSVDYNNILVLLDLCIYRNYVSSRKRITQHLGMGVKLHRRKTRGLRSLTCAQNTVLSVVEVI